MKGSAGIEVLQLEVLNKLIEKLPIPPSMFFANLLPEVPYDSDQIRWEIEYNSGGMTPFVAPGSVAPTVGIDGVSEASAKAAYWKEKMFFDEEFLNNLRQPGTHATYQRSERQLAKGTLKLRNRCLRRREWMAANMFLNGAMTYQIAGGAKFSLSYGVPESHMVTLDSTRYWNGGASKNILEDIMEGKRILAEDAGVVPTYPVLNSRLLQLLVLDTSIQALLQKSAFGDGDLFSNPAAVVGQLLGVGPLMVYDDLYEIQGWLTQTVSGTTIYLDDVSDFEVGGTARFINMVTYNTYEDETITAVDVENGTITVAEQPTASFVGGRDKVVMRKKFIPDNVFFLFSPTQDGINVGEFMAAPYGLARRWGYFADTKDEWDPEGIWLRVQDKGLPVLYYPDTTYKLTVYEEDEY